MTDSSLLDEWETLRDPDYRPAIKDDAPAKPSGLIDITRDRTAFTRLVRNEVFSFLRSLANKQYKQLDERYNLDRLFPDAKWKYTALEEAMVAYYTTHDWIRLDPAARSTAHTRIKVSEDRATWIIEQTLVDPEELNDLQLSFELSITSAQASGSIALIPVAIEAIL